MTLEEFAFEVVALHDAALFGDADMDPVDGDTLDPFAEQHFLAALALLESAKAAAKLALLYQTRALASSPRP